MSRSYNAWDPNPRARDSASAPYDQPRDSRQGPRLPPPETLVSGAPAGSALHNLHQQYPPPPRALQLPHQPPPGLNTYTQHSPSLPRSPAGYQDASFASSNQLRHYPHPGHVSPASSQTSNPSSFTHPDSRLYRPVPGHPQPQYPPHGQHHQQQQQHRPQIANQHLQTYQPPRRIAPSTSAMGQQLSRSPSTPRQPAFLNLLGEDRVGALEGMQFKLKLRQQPRAARSCGFGDRDRRVVDPPPIVELIIEGPNLLEGDARRYQEYDSYVMTCTIRDDTGTQDASVMPEEFRGQRRLMGTCVATPFFGKDEFGQEGCFFCFSDLSCRQPGFYRLHFNLAMLNPNDRGHNPFLCEITSEVFQVFNAKDFPGMIASSRLARRLKEQGCIISIKKGAEKPKIARSQGQSSTTNDDENDMDDDDGDDDDGDSQGKRKRRS